MIRMRIWMAMIVTPLVLSTDSRVTGDGLMQADKVMRVNVPQTVGPPGGQVAVPMHLNLPEGVEVGSITLKIGFPAKSLTFVKMALGGLAEGVGAEVKADVKEGGEESVLEVTVSTPEKDGARTPLPAGPVAQMLFTIAKDSKPETVFPLKIQGTATGIKGGGAIKVEARDGQIIVSDPAVISCFFYMH